MTIPTIQPLTNRYDGYSYNEAGAVLSDGSYTFTYDALDQPLSKIYNNNNATQEYYIYTPNDERIGVQSHGWWWWSIRDESGKVLRQYKSSATNPSTPALWVEDFIWRDGLLLGSQRPTEMGGRRHFHLDHLGSPRLITSDSGQMVSYHDYYPFGDEKSSIWQEGPSAGGFDREEPMKFTGHERDYASGMGAEDGRAVDYMHARYYSATAGRFLSVDPMLGDSYVPQSWNRYAYVRNNSMLFNDPTGRAVALSILPSGAWVSNVLDLQYAPGEEGKLKQSDIASLLQHGANSGLILGSLRQSINRFLQVHPLWLGRGPDYFAFTVNAGSIGGVTAVLVNDRYGRLYLGGGLNIGKSSTTVSGSFVGGWLNQRAVPNKTRLYKYLIGGSINGGVGFIVGAGRTWGMPGVGNEGGVFSPQAGVSATYAIQLKLQGYEWSW
jgi:RHS repeat-associated protein